ncbi:hypothetical protein ACJX0J_033676, partial [Zea mays]
KQIVESHHYAKDLNKLFTYFIFAQKEREDESSKIAFGNLMEKKLDEGEIEAFDEAIIQPEFSNLQQNEEESHLASEEARKAEEASIEQLLNEAAEEREIIYLFFCLDLFHNSLTKTHLQSEICMRFYKLLYWDVGIRNPCNIGLNRVTKFGRHPYAVHEAA